MARSPLFARKSVDDIRASGEAEGVGLHKALGPVSITAMGIGAIIGAGIFVLTGTAAAQYAGPGIMISFVICGIACAFVGLCYAELAALIPVSGSSYTYTYATLGELFAWIIGWDLVLEYAVAASTVAVGWSAYLVRLLARAGIGVPHAWTMAPFDDPVTLADGTIVHGILNLPAALIVVIITALLVMGTRESARTNTIMVGVKLAVVLLFIALGVGAIDTANWSPLIPENHGNFGEFGLTGVLRGASVVFFAFIGFDAVSTAAQEARNPQRDMPIGILGSLAICTLLYVAVSAVMTGLVSYTQLNVAAPIGLAVDVLGLPWISFIIDIGVLAGLTTVILVSLYGQTRIFYTMSHDGLLPPLFAHIHPSWRTPWLSQIVIGAFVAIAAALAPLDILGELVSIGTLFAFMLVCGAVIYLRKSDADRFRPFRVPGVPVVPILGILCCLGLMYFLPLDTWLRLIIWLGIGLAIYAFYGRHHSRLRTLAERQR
ncbi:MAG: amino acid permease [Alphaproteobacteria bacterium]|nr:amino acid permease [Alphaproteobacteria bacterium]